MADPTRLLDGAGSDLERELLMAGCDELPDPAAKQRAAAALAIGAAASIWPAAAATGAAKGAKAGVPLIVKLLAIGAVGAGTAAGGAHYLRTAADPAPPREAAAVTQRAPESARAKAVAQPQAAEQEATPVESLVLEMPSEALKPAPGTRSSTEKASIADEMRVLDEARRALSAGDGAGTMRVLDTYRKQFPRGSFSQEAVLLRIQALVQVGDHGAARALAQRFRDRHPNSPHLRRIETILGEK